VASNPLRSRSRDENSLRAVADRLIDALDLRDAVDGSIKAANESGLPQGEGGPADAYRHLLIVGEIKRRFAAAGSGWRARIAGLSPRHDAIALNVGL